MGRHDPVAALARRSIEATLGVEVEHWDVGGRQGAYDLRYTRGARSVAVEVKLVVDEDYRRAESEADYTTDDRLAACWHVWLRHSASWKRARRALPDILALLEQSGWPADAPLWQLRHWTPDVHDRVVGVGVTAMWRTAATDRHPPGFYLTPAGWGGYGDPSIDDAVGEASRLLAGPTMERLRRQLAGADTGERHAYLFVGWEYPELWLPLRRDSDDLPGEPPQLPDPVDGLWLTGTTGGSRVVAWLPGDGWVAGIPGDSVPQ